MQACNISAGIVTRVPDPAIWLGGGGGSPSRVSSPCEKTTEGDETVTGAVNLVLSRTGALSESTSQTLTKLTLAKKKKEKKNSQYKEHIASYRFCEVLSVYFMRGLCCLVSRC